MKGEKCFLEEEEEKDKIKWKSDHLLKQSWWFNIKMKTNGKGGGGGGGFRCWGILLSNIHFSLHTHHSF